MLAPLRIGRLTLPLPVIQAPMSGVTGRAFRRFIRELNPGAVGLYYTEFASVEGLARENKATLRLIRRAAEDKNDPFAAQIFGRDVMRMAEAAAIVEQMGADLVDINAGCPAPAIVKKGGGAELLKKPLLIGEIVAAVKKAVKIPVAVKIRTGWDENTVNVLETSRIIESSGADMLTVHGRNRMQGFKGSADWNLIAQAKANVRIPVIGNGDINDPAFAMECFRKYGIDGIMVARAMLRDPWIFNKIRAHAEGNTSSEPGTYEKTAVFMRYAELLSEDGLPEKAVLGKMKQLAVKYLRLKPNGAEIRTQALRSENLKDFFGFAKEYFQ